MAEKLKGRGGKGRGQGRKPLNAVTSINVKLRRDELAKYESDPVGSPSLLRFLLRRHYGLCLHGIITENVATGISQCFECGATDFEDFSRLHRQLKGNPTDLDMPPQFD
jgi:hypothetical protein